MNRHSFILVGILLLAVVFLQDTMSLDLAQTLDMGAPDEADYISFLQEFPKYAERQWHGNYRGDPEIGYFGSGSANIPGRLVLAIDTENPVR